MKIAKAGNAVCEGPYGGCPPTGDISHGDQEDQQPESEPCQGILPGIPVKLGGVLGEDHVLDRSPQ